ncbi:MAG TPA: hopanoid biosynthesis-associated protein HpnK [Caulobacteraceae bacterium]|jgi:hopanoid biosynthesis associated protein HpnK
MSDRRLVITADDFGLHGSVNAAVRIGHEQGVLSAASLMVGAPAAAEAVAVARNLPNLRVGLHLVLTDGRPVLPPEQVPHLVNGEGAFRNDMAAMGAIILASSTARRELGAEIEAQFFAFAATGLVLDHVNAHKHFHVHPTIAAVTARIGARFGLRAVRAPVEPAATLTTIEPGAAGWTDRMAAWWAKRASVCFRRAGVVTPDQVFGLRWSGHMTAPRLAGVINALPPGLSEVYLHPATDNVFPGSASGYDYRGELAALTSDGARKAISGLQVGGYQDFV